MRYALISLETRRPQALRACGQELSVGGFGLSYLGYTRIPLIRHGASYVATIPAAHMLYTW